MRISAYFYDDERGILEKACCSIFEARGGERIGSGTILVGAAAGERDVEYDVPDAKAEETRAALKKAGFRLQPTPDGDMP